MSAPTPQLRLKMLSGGKSLSWLQKLKLLPIRLMSGKYPGPMLVMSHRRELAGRAYAEFLESSMRKLSHWTAGEAELLASFTAGQLECNY